MKKFLWVSYSILFILLIICFVVYFTNPFGINWLKEFSLNLATQVIGILLVVFLIDRVISINQENERKKRQVIALQQLQIPLRRHFILLFNIFKSSIQVKPDKNYKHVSDLFDDTYFVQIAFFDFSKPAPVIPLDAWFNYLSRECSQFREALNRTIEKYSLYVESDIIDLMEETINSSFISFIIQAPAIQAPAIREVDTREGVIREYNLFGGQGTCDLVKEYTSLFSKLIESYNQNVPDEKRIKMTDDLWRNDVAPKIGSSRI